MPRDTSKVSVKEAGPPPLVSSASVDKLQKKPPLGDAISNSHSKKDVHDIFTVLDIAKTANTDLRGVKARQIATEAARALAFSRLRSVQPTRDQNVALARVTDMVELKFAADLVGLLPLNVQVDKEKETAANIFNMYIAQSFLEAYGNGNHWPPKRNKQAIHVYFYASAVESALLPDKEDPRELQRIYDLFMADPILVTYRKAPDVVALMNRYNDVLGELKKGVKATPDAIAKLKAEWLKVQQNHPFKFM
jgi:hypothetical protein